MTAIIVALIAAVAAIVGSIITARSTKKRGAEHAEAKLDREINVQQVLAAIELVHTDVRDVRTELTATRLELKQDLQAVVVKTERALSDHADNPYAHS